jgi:RHS repeat-associated protein
MTASSVPRGCDRHVRKEAGQIDDTKSRKFTYDASDLLTLDERENCYPGSTTCTKSSFVWDALQRNSSWSRLVTDTTNAIAGFQYGGPQERAPSTVTTGDGTTTATSTTYVHDDFGQLIEYGSPDGATTRLVYDVGGRLTTRREGNGTADQRTSVMTYDSAGRLLSVDHDTEHPVDCATAATGTPITDVDYVYDVCPAPTPTGFSCGSHTTGQLTRARVKLFCEAGTAFARSTWYSYDDRGRISSQAIADDETMTAPFVTSHEWTLAGRLKRVENPLSTTYGMDVVYDDAGHATEVRQTDGAATPYVSSIAYAPFGPPLTYTTQSMMGGQALVRELAYFLDYNLQETRARRGASVTGGFVYARDAMGRVTARDSHWSGAGAPIDRHFLYDRVGRLLCETTTAQSTCPTSGPDLRSTFTYTNGQSQLAPDNRATATFSTLGGTAGSYSYAAGTSRLTNVGGYLIFAHDALGRRTSDDDTTYSGLVGGRQYTYLPNGRLGTIAGKTVEVVPGGYLLDVDYVVALAYDDQGRVFHMARTSLGETETWDLHYDALGRIIATRWTPKASSGASVTDNLYAYLGEIRVARVQVDTGAMRYWSVDDGLGTAFEEVSEAGLSTLRDREAFGTTTNSSTGALTFGFPGQFEIPGTTVLRGEQCIAGCGVPGVPCPPTCGLYFMRPGLQQNWHREYDPAVGRYLELDAMDERSSRGLAQTWNYAVSDPVNMVDRDGREATAGVLTSPFWETAAQAARQLAARAWASAWASPFAVPLVVLVLTSEVAEPEIGRMPKWRPTPLIPNRLPQDGPTEPRWPADPRRPRPRIDPPVPLECEPVTPKPWSDAPSPRHCRLVKVDRTYPSLVCRYECPGGAEDNFPPDPSVSGGCRDWIDPQLYPAR